MTPRRNPSHAKARPVPNGNRHQRTKRFDSMSKEYLKGDAK